MITSYACPLSHTHMIQKREALVSKPPSFAAPKKVPVVQNSRGQTGGGNSLTVSMEVTSNWTKLEQSTSENDSRDFNKSADSAFLSPIKATPPSQNSSTAMSPKAKRSPAPRQSSERSE